jgi:hypothetical protein
VEWIFLAVIFAGAAIAKAINTQTAVTLNIEQERRDDSAAAARAEINGHRLAQVAAAWGETQPPAVIGVGQCGVCRKAPAVVYAFGGGPTCVDCCEEVTAHVRAKGQLPAGHG